MARDDDARSVDFVVGDDLSLPPIEPTPAAPGRRRRMLVGLAVAALVVAGVLWGAAGAKQRSVSAARTSPDRPSATLSAAPNENWRRAPTTALLALPSAEQLVVLDARTGSVIRCPTYQACSLTNHVPGSVQQAIRAAFPAATVRSASSALLRRDNARYAYLAQRIVVARAGATTITIEVRGPGQVPVHGSATVGRSVMRSAVDGRSVTVTVSVAARASLPPGAVLDRLVADPRLLSQ